MVEYICKSKERRYCLFKLKKPLSVLLLSLVAFLSVARVSTEAVSVNIRPKELTYFTSVGDKRVSSYSPVTLYLGDNRINEDAYLINETTYVPLRAALTLAGAVISFDAKTRTATARMEGLDMSVTDGSYILHANGRPLLSKTPSVILSDGRMYVPVRSLAKALSLEVYWLPPRSVKLGGTPKPLVSWDHYYASDDLYWLSRIISAESQGEPLLGQIAVGNVVLNRMRHKDYPNTIWGVIFDTKHGVQFSPIVNGSVYKTPAYNSVIAAKICLEGISLSPDALFFMEPTKSTSSWIYNNRPYAFTVGNHYFFY